MKAYKIILSFIIAIVLLGAVALVFIAIAKRTTWFGTALNIFCAVVFTVAVASNVYSMVFGRKREK